uniref:Transmembrane protein n=1 Tax=viral metagenome TaxID=1070528 RepID=A0A6C0BTZ1_9ZZZZ
MMLRKTQATDMENLLDTSGENKNKCLQNCGITILLFSSYAMFFGLGFYTSMHSGFCSDDDGSNI